MSFREFFCSKRKIKIVDFSVFGVEDFLSKKLFVLVVFIHRHFSFIVLLVLLGVAGIVFERVGVDVARVVVVTTFLDALVLVAVAGDDVIVVVVVFVFLRRQRQRHVRLLVGDVRVQLVVVVFNVR